LKKSKLSLGDRIAAIDRKDGFSGSCMTRRGFAKGAALAIGLASLAYVSSKIPKVYADIITFQPLSNPVTIDGKWTNGSEWTDGYEETSPACNWRFKYDSNSLYVLSDFFGVNESYPGDYDASWVYFDTLGNGGSAPDTDDYAFGILPSLQNSLTMLQGTGSDWSVVKPNFNGASSDDASNDPYGPNPHPIYEFQIPMSIFPANVKSANMRVATEAPFQGWYDWPQYSDRLTPSSWGNVEFAPVPVPEFPSLGILTVALGIPLYLMRRRKAVRQIHRKTNRPLSSANGEVS